MREGEISGGEEERGEVGGGDKEMGLFEVESGVGIE
jgi:hypothetical protein